MTNTSSRSFRRPGRVLGSALMLVAVAAGAPSCADESISPLPTPTKGACIASLNTAPKGDALVPVADPANPVTATFKVTIDPSDPAFKTEQRQPLAAPLKLDVVSGELKLWGGVKTFVKHPERLWVELYFINDQKVGVKDAQVTISGVTGSASFYDFNEDPWAAPTSDQTMLLGGIAPEGVSRIMLGFDADANKGPISFKIDLVGKTTTRTATSSTPIQVTPDGKEVWSVQADSDIVSVIDAASDKRVAQVTVSGRPSSVAITPDGKLALVACASCNQLTVIDRASRKVTQIFSEAEGIGRDPRNVVISPDGARAYVSAYVGDSVTALERVGDAFRVLKEIPVGRRPVGMSVTPDGGTVLVAHFMPRGKLQDNMGWVSVVAADMLTEASQIELRDDANVKESGCSQKIPGFDAYTAEELSFEGVPTELAGVFLDPAGLVGWTPGLRVAPFPIFEGNVKNTGFDFITIGSNSPAALFPIDTRDPRKAQPSRLRSVIDINDRQEDFLRCVPYTEELEAAFAFPVPGKPDELQNAGSVLPSGASPLSESGVSRFVGFTRGGRRALVLSYTADELMVVDAVTRNPTSQRHFTLSGSNPTGIAVTPDGAKGYVTYENSLSVSVLDLSAYAGATLPEPGFVPYHFDYSAGAGQAGGAVTFGSLTRDIKGVPELPPIKETGAVPLVDSDPMDPVLRRGKLLFTSSSPVKYPTLSASREASCSACHPNGGNDGSVWPTMEGERRTIGLWGGTAKRGWLHASATHTDSTVFATVIVKERLGGTGLSDADMRALSEYTARGIPALQRPRVDDALAAKGKAIFQGRCVSCHAGDKYTSGNPDLKSAYGGGMASGPSLYDVGSATAWAGAILGEPYANLFPSTPKALLLALRGDRLLGTGDVVETTLMFDQRPERKRGQFKAPSLTNTWENVVYFHDGRAATLEDAVKDIAAKTGEPLGDADLKAVVEFLKTL